ncbi:Speckle-type POZ protein [Araneus ventricosus]|uniref:Speckle-type POZ protein n=1 Tax=Araneus ventricosus TaxID=182803 RepID=A0A4Y2C3N6_ARAVE|nr:Speckle-type POZ protein [Araneus ventricosus]
MAEDNEDTRNGFTFIWTALKLSRGSEQNGLLQTAPEILSSPPFFVDSLEKTGWCLMMLISKKGDHITCSLSRIIKDNGPQKIEIEFELSFLAANGSSLIKSKRRNLFSHNEVCIFESFAKKNDVLVKRKGEILQKESLTIRCRMWKVGDTIPKPALSFARSELRVETESFFCAIERFSSLKTGEKKSFLVKPKFREIQPLTLNVGLSDGGDDVQVQMTSEDAKLMVSMSWEISAIDSIGRVIDCANFNFLIHQKHVSQIPRLTSKSKLTANRNLYLPNDVLLLRCSYTTRYIGEITYDSQTLANVENTINALTLQNHKAEESSVASMSLAKDLKGLYEEGVLCDVHLLAEGMTFPAHKNVLSARSSVFKLMFTQDEKVMNSKEVNLPDVDAASVRKMLKFIYTDVVNDLDSGSALSLYTAAACYELVPLKNECSEFLKDNLNLLNVFDVLILAEKHNDDELQKEAKDFVLNHDEDLLRSDKWEFFKKNYKQLAFDIMEIICLKKTTKK